MARHIHDHGGSEYPSNLLRSLGVRPGGGVGVVVLLAQGELDVATGVEAEAALAPALETRPQHA